MANNLIDEIVELSKEIITESQKREDCDLVPLFQRVLHLARMVKNRSFELWALSELEGYQNESVLQELQGLSKQESLEFKSLRRLRSFPADCFLDKLKTQFLATGELLASEPGRATLTMPLKELEMSYLTDREYYKQTYSVSAPLSLSLLERAFTQMKNRIYNFASEVYLRYRLTRNIGSIFEDKISSVNQQLARFCPKVLEHLNQALEQRLLDKRQAIISLRETLISFAEFLLPTTRAVTFELSEQFYLNRMCQFFEENINREKSGLSKANYRSLINRTEAIYKRIRELNQIEQYEVESLIIQTYFLISDTIDLYK
jgi:hypothetical protein